MSRHHRIRVLDRVGAAGSLLCAVHCALVPVVIALLPTLGIAAWLGDSFERGFVIFATLLGLFTVFWGWRRHGEVRALWLLVPGLAALWLGISVEVLHHDVIAHAMVMIVGGGLVGMAHLLNLRLYHGHVHNAQCVH